MPPNYRGLVALCLAIALVTGATAAAGVLLRGDGSTAQATSVRGETYSYATTGVYEYNAERVVAEGVGWDWVTLCFAVPALLAALPFVARGSLKARLFAMGILGYFVYQYLMYAVFWAFGPLFVPFIAIYSASAIAIVWLVSTIDVRRPARAVLGQVPAQDDGDHEHRDRAHARGDVGAAYRRRLPR